MNKCTCLIAQVNCFARKHHLSPTVLTNSDTHILRDVGEAELFLEVPLWVHCVLALVSADVLLGVVEQELGVCFLQTVK